MKKDIASEFNQIERRKEQINLLYKILGGVLVLTGFLATMVLGGFAYWVNFNVDRLDGRIDAQWRVISKNN